MGKTSIGWTHRTWNPIRGCSRVSEGCRNCYAEHQAARIVRMGKGKPTPYDGLVKVVGGQPRWTGEVRFVGDNLLDPLGWRKPQMVFVNSMSDLFHDAVPDDRIDQIVAVMMISSLHETRGGHVMQTLTKRAHRMRAYFGDPKTQGRVAVAAGRLMEDTWSDDWHDAIAYRKEGLVHPLLWWGVSIEDQDAANDRAPQLAETPAAVRFVSVEPILGAVDLRRWLGACACNVEAWEGAGMHDGRCPATKPRGIHWVIVGCESGPGARTAQAGWYRALRDQCSAADIPFFLKQSRTRDPVRGVALGEDGISGGDGSHYKPDGLIEAPYLDGRKHLAFPPRPAIFSPTADNC